MIEEQIKAQTKVLLEIKDILDKSSQRQSAISENVKAIKSGIDLMSGTIAVDTVRNQRGEVIEQKVVVDNLKDALSVVTKGSQRFIRITALGEDFCLGLKLAEDGKEMKWQEAIDYCKEHQRDLLTKRQYLIVAIFHDEINKMLESLGGDKLGYEWSVSECNYGYVWSYGGHGGTLYINDKYNRYQVRPSLAHFSNLQSFNLRLVFFKKTRQTPTNQENMLRHDVCHCKGEHDGVVCPKREECHRYALHVEAVKLHLTMYADYFDAGTCADLDYEYFVQADKKGGSHGR